MPLQYRTPHSTIRYRSTALQFTLVRYGIAAYASAGRAQYAQPGSTICWLSTAQVGSSIRALSTG
eukprot:3941017-Rhodomonas_salina.4